MVEINVDTKKICSFEGQIVKKLEKRLKDLKAKKMKEELDRREQLRKDNMEKSKKNRNFNKLTDVEKVFKEDKLAEISNQNPDINPDEAFLSVNIDGVLVKKNFDYFLIDKEEITDYIGREPTYIQ